MTGLGEGERMMNRADRMMTEWLAEVEAFDRHSDIERARKEMENTLAYQAAAFLDVLENVAMTVLRALRIGR